MTATGKKDYVSVIESCTSINTAAQHHAKLNRIYVSTEDTRLKALLKPALDALSRAHNRLASAKHANQKGAASIREAPFKDLLAYCQSCIDSVEPQWQLIAKREGWTPPEESR